MSKRPLQDLKPSGSLDPVIDPITRGSTPLGAEGLDPRYVSVGEGAHALADRALEIIRDGELRSSRAREGRSYTERDFRWENVLLTLEDCIAGR